MNWLQLNGLLPNEPAIGSFADRQREREGRCPFLERREEAKRVSVPFLERG